MLSFLRESVGLLILTGLAAAQNSIAYAPDHININYTTVPGYFLQDLASTNATTFQFTQTNFGLLNQTYPSIPRTVFGRKPTQWQMFEEVVEKLNAGADIFTTYKVLFMGRHGDGYHNAEQAYVGTPAWNCYYSLLDGNSTVTWADAHLTPLGISQAQTVNAFWAHELAVQKTPYPQSYYVSPLTRCLQTANITFAGLSLPFAHPFAPTIKELLRESISGHTCDRRSNAASIHDAFPWYKLEEGFKFNDTLWEKGQGETNINQDIRSRKVLNDIFVNDRNTWISITSHSGEIASILRVLGHRTFSLGTGAVIPVLVKAVRLHAPAPTTSVQPYTTISTCASPPAATATS